jgi:hypothetical protein
VGSYVLQNPCKICGEATGNYPDVVGKPRQYCGLCAEKAGTHVVQNPCKKCGETESHYPDADDKPRQYCGPCAVDAGLKAKACHGASMVACQCWDKLERLLGIKLQHIHYVPGKDKPEGKEVEGLVPGRRNRPDAYDPESQTVYQFHGNMWHGYPPEHPKHLEFNERMGMRNDELYKRTLEVDDLYRDTGYTVRVVWEHEYRETTRSVCPRKLVEILR